MKSYCPERERERDREREREREELLSWERSKYYPEKELLPKSQGVTALREMRFYPEGEKLLP